MAPEEFSENSFTCLMSKLVIIDDTLVYETFMLWVKVDEESLS